MSQPRFKIVFAGELMPGTQLDEVKDNLARLFKSDLSKIAPLFSGNPVALKRDLPSEDADKYLAALQRAGAKAHKEPEPSAGLSLAASDEQSGPATVASPAVDAEHMTCPKCGHVQAKAAECAACGIIIEKFLARQVDMAAAPATTDVATPGPGATPYAPPTANVAATLPEYDELATFGIEGRLGRLRYLAWSMTLMAAAMALFGVVAIGMQISEVIGLLLGVPAAIAVAVVSIQIGIRRLHDIGWSGWLLLVNLVPVVGSVFSLIMLVVPGSNGANRYGPPPPPNSRSVKVLAALWLLVPILGILAAISMPAYQDYIERAQQAAQHSSYPSESSEEADPYGAQDPAED